MWLAALCLYVWFFKHRVNQADFMVFYRAAHEVRLHLSPYPDVLGASVYSGSSFVYPYLSAWAFVPFSYLPLQGAQDAFVVTSVLAVLGTLRVLGVRGKINYALFLLASSTVVAWQMGTLNPFLALGLALVWRYRDSPWFSGPFLVLIAFAKLFLMPVLLWLFIARRWKSLAMAVATFGVVILINFSTGSLPVAAYVHLLESLSRHEGPRGLSLASVLAGPLTMAESEFVVCLAVLVAAYGLLRVYLTSGNEVLVFGGSVALALVLTPIMWSSYLLIVGTVAVVVFPYRSTIPIYSGVSWLVTTPDRVGAAGDAVSLAIIGLGCAVLLRSSWLEREANHVGVFRGFQPAQLVVGVLVSALALCALAVEPAKAPAIVVQALLLSALGLAGARGIKMEVLHKANPGGGTVG